MLSVGCTCSLFPTHRNPQRVSKYEPYRDRLNLDGINFPVTFVDIPTFERQNNLSINVYELTNGEDESTSLVFPMYQTTNKKSAKTVNLLLLRDGDNAHYCWIKSLDRLLSRNRSHNGRKFICSYCLQPCYSQARLEAHEADCANEEGQTVQLPDEEERDLKFRNTHRMLRQPLVLYADFESLLEQMATCQPNPASSYVQKTNLHTPCGASLFEVSQCCDESTRQFNQLLNYRGPDCVEQFLEAVIDRFIEHQKAIDASQGPPNVDPAEAQRLRCEAKCCNICKEAIRHCDACIIAIVKARRDNLPPPSLCTGCSKVLAIDHCHFCGKIRGVAHIGCNINYRLNRNMVVGIHNLRRYDSHLIFQKIGQIVRAKGLELGCIPKGLEDYLMFSVIFPRTHAKALPIRINFIDTCQFLACPLATLVSNLAKEGPDFFSWNAT